MCGVQVSCQSQELPLSWLISKCVHILPLMVSSYAINPRPSGARVDLNKPHQALRKHCLSQVWRWSPDDAPSADRHDKQFLREWQRPFGSYLDKVLFWAKQQKIFTVMYNLTEKACELQKVKEVRMWLIGFNVSAWDARHERLLPKLYQCLWYFNNPTSSLTCSLIPGRWYLFQTWLTYRLLLSNSSLQGPQSRMLER